MNVPRPSSGDLQRTYVVPSISLSLRDKRADNCCLCWVRWLVGLVALADQVVGQRLDGGGGVSGDVGLAVVADDDGLLRLGDSDAEAALHTG
jgi:hypothetical protein